MKNSIPENDEKLSRLLRESKADAPLPPRFQEGVWRRIESSASARVRQVSWGDMFAHWLGAILPRPAMATAYIAVLLTIGITVGWAQAQQTNARVKADLSERYVSVLDPYQAQHH
jgi:hypothetical protein